MTTRLNSRPFFIFALFAAVFVVYSYSLTFGFVFDDNVQVLENSWITGVSNIPVIFRSSAWAYMDDHSGSNFYRPMMHLVYMVEYHLFGLKPWGFHLVNILLHSLNAVLVFTVASTLSSKAAGGEADGEQCCLTPFLAALLFAIHPINTEVVSWVAAVPELTATLFLLLSFLQYLRATSGGGLRAANYALSVILFFPALLSKETGVVLPLIIFAYSISVNRWGAVREWKRYIPYAAVFSVYMVIRTSAVGGLISHKQEPLSLYENIINIFPLVASYFGKLIVPVGLKAVYPFKAAHSIFEPMVLLGLAAITAYAVSVYLSGRSRRMRFALMWIIIPLLPVMYVPAVSIGGFADRYMYMSSIGYSMTLAFCAAFWLPERARATGARTSARPAAYALLAAVLVLYAAGTVNRSRVWKDDYTLWTDTVRNFPENVQQSENVHFNLAWILQKRGKLDRAEEEYKKALSRNPGRKKANFNIAKIYEDRGDAQAAIMYYAEELKVNPVNEEALYNIATLFIMAGNPKAAVTYLERLLSLNPEHENAHYNLAYAYDLLNDGAAAVTHYLEVLRLSPGSADAYFNLGTTYRGMGLYDKAAEAFRAALRIKPDYTDARLALGNLPGQPGSGR